MRKGKDLKILNGKQDRLKKDWEGEGRLITLLSWNKSILYLISRYLSYPVKIIQLAMC